MVAESWFSWSEFPWRRFLIASAVFLAFETLMILALHMEAIPGSEGAFWLIGIAAAVGYLLLGAFGGSAFTLLVACLPALIAYLIEPSIDDPRGELWPLGAIWVMFSMFGFLPAWFFGLFIHLAAKDSRGELG